MHCVINGNADPEVIDLSIGIESLCLDDLDQSYLIKVASHACLCLFMLSIICSSYST